MSFAEFIGGLFGDAGFTEPEPELFNHAAVAELLPYRIYDPEKRFYYNEDTTGFLIEIPPMVPGEESDQKVANLHTSLITTLPASAGFQVISWASPEIDGQLRTWARTRVEGGELVEEIAASRLEHIRDMRFGTPDLIKSVPCDRRVFIAGWVDGDAGLSTLKALEEYRNAIISSLGLTKEAGLHPTDFIQLIEEILHAERWDGFARTEYNDEIPLNAQIPGATIKVGPDHIEFGGSPRVSVKASSVAKFPQEWASALGIMLAGDPDKISDRPHGPVLTALSAVSIPSQKATANMISRVTKLEHAKKTGFAKFTTNHQGKIEEVQKLSEELERGERLFHGLYTVLSYSKGGKDEANNAANEMTKIFRRVGFALRREKRIQLPLLVSALPLGMTEKTMGAFGKLMRMRVLKLRAITALAPFMGEFKGNSNGTGMLLMGRQGQLVSWSNFQSEGNYNVAVVGKSGAGKSVFMQDLITAIYSNGGRALVIDDGYSFKTTCEILGGRHIAFDGEQRIGLNPFSMLQGEKMEVAEYQAEAVELLTRVISSMAALGEQREGRVSGIEEQAIATAVLEVWQEKGPEGEITDVYNKLDAAAKKEERLRDVCTRIYTYTVGGTYGQFFHGPATVNVDSPFTVVELSDLKSQPDLEQVVLQLIMFLGTELMYKTDRSVPVAILIDEAWDLLKGEGTAKFLEGVVRRARKYTGALITGTQSINDYYHNPAANVCIENSDWLVCLAQKAETIDGAEREGRLNLPPGFGARLKSITSVPGQFSELAIKGPSGWFFGRLALDAFSLAVFSSKGSTVENLRRRKEQGMTTVEALKDMVEKGEVV